MKEKGRVLIVDDDANARATAEALLFAEGHDLAFATNGSEALAKASELVPDLVLLDVMMPEMDGFEVCRRLRASPLLGAVPIILVTALDDRASRLQGIEAGADDFVSKPLDGVELRARVSTVIQLNRYRRLLEEQDRRREAEDEIRRLYQALQRHAATLEETVAQRTRELQAERDRTQAILDALGEAVVVADLDGIIQYVNPAAASLTGYAKEEALGQDVSLWQGDSQPAGQYAQMWEAVRAGKTWRGEVVSRRRDGTVYDAMLSMAPLAAAGDPSQPAGFVSVQRDITPLKEAERIKDRFVSNVSHELRTPLSVLVLTTGNLDALYDRLDDARRRRMIRDLREQTRVLNDLISDVLEISRIDGGHIAVERQRLDLTELVRLEVEKQLPLARTKSQSLCVMGDESLSVWGNSGQLRQVMRNLLNNAIKYTPQGGRIACKCRVLGDETGTAEWPGSAGLSGGQWAAVCVVDTGISIGSEHLPHLFERFYRVETEGDIPGTGLGLSIAKELVELHGGHIGVASTLGRGSVFAFYLPLLEEE
jgi:two-component system cell cycle sensor histidine kinase/response regulator CckA